MKVPKPRKLSSGNWFIQMRLGGGYVNVTASTEKECIRQAELLKAQHRNDIKVESQKGKTVKLCDAIDNYINEKINVLSPSTIVGYRNIRRNRFQNYMTVQVGKINWQKAVNDEAGRCSPKTLKNAFRLMKSVCRENGVEIDSKVILPEVVKPDKQWLSPEQIPIFVNAIHETKGEIPALLALHSLRKSEVCGLEWDNIDLDNGIIHVRGALLIDENGEWNKRQANKTKASTRDVPIFIPNLRTALEAVEDKTGYVVKQHPETPYRQIQKVCQEYDLPLVGWHGLRHSFASLCYSLDINELTCMQLGGWSDYQTMRTIYTHLAESDRLKAADKLKDFFKNAN